MDEPRPRAAQRGGEGEGIESGDLGEGRSWTYVASKKGEIDYICRLHPVMHGVVTVR